MTKQARWLYAITFLTVAFASVFTLQAIHAEPANQTRGGDQSSSSGDTDSEEARVDLGQNREAEADGLTADQRWLKENYPETFQTKGQIVVFSATWCGPCRRYAPTVRALQGRYNVLKFDIDDKRGRVLFDKFGGTSVPLTVILVEGKIKQKYSGPQRMGTLEKTAFDCRKEKDDNKTNRIKVGPLNIGIDGNDVDIHFSRRACA